MISAPLRTAKTQTNKTTSSVKTHGHLALMEWEDLPSTQTTTTPSFKSPTRRTGLDRCYDGGTAILFVVTVGSLIVTLCRF